MKHVTEVRYFECRCSKCGISVQNKGGVRELKENGWLELTDDLLCPECVQHYKNLSVGIGDNVVCLIQNDVYHLDIGKVYQVCDLPHTNDGSIYVDVGNGWQAKLQLGEYDMSNNNTFTPDEAVKALLKAKSQDDIDWVLAHLGLDDTRLVVKQLLCRYYNMIIEAQIKSGIV